MPKKGKVIGILCADIHLRDDVPLARTDDYWKAQQDKFIYILDLSHKYECPIFIAGDIFEKARSSQFLEQWAISTIREHCIMDIFVVPGQHDLPNHNIDLYDKSSLCVLESAGVIKVAKVPCNDEKTVGHHEVSGIRIGMMHTMVYKVDPIHESVGGAKASVLLKRFKEYDILLTGDNHKTFTYMDKDKRILVNPGSMMRMDADQMRHKPTVFLLHDDGLIGEVYLPILVQNAVTREHIEKKEVLDTKVQTFIKRIKEDYEVGISFRKNLKAFFRKNKNTIKKSIEEKVWRAIDNEQ